jgi:hypothetical protein
MVQYLKLKLDRAFHQRRSLDAQKATLLSELKEKENQREGFTSRTLTMPFLLFANPFPTKKEMKEIDSELSECRLWISEMESAIDHLKVKIGERHPDRPW